MAPTSDDETGSAAAGAAKDPRIDLFSPHFDADFALDSPLLSVPYPDVQPLNNLSECRRLLPSTSAHTSSAPVWNGVG